MRQTFNYETHNLCGGKTRARTTLGPRKEAKSAPKRNDSVQQTVYATYVASLSKVVNVGTTGQVQTRAMPESELLERTAIKQGEAVTTKTGSMGAATYLRNARWLKQQAAPKPEPKPETQDEWLRRHKLGPYAPQNTVEVAWTAK